MELDAHDLPPFRRTSVSEKVRVEGYVISLAAGV